MCSILEPMEVISRRAHFLAQKTALLENGHTTCAKFCSAVTSVLLTISRNPTNRSCDSSPSAVCVDGQACEEGLQGGRASARAVDTLSDDVFWKCTNLADFGNQCVTSAEHRRNGYGPSKLETKSTVHRKPETTDPRDTPEIPEAHGRRPLELLKGCTSELEVGEVSFTQAEVPTLMDQHPRQERFWTAWQEQAYRGQDENWKNGQRPSLKPLVTRSRKKQPGSKSRLRSEATSHRP